MERWRGIDQIPTGWGRCVLTIGVFDGVHRGHQELIGRVVSRGRQLSLPTVLMTFDPHPSEVVRPGSHPAVLSTLRRRAELVDQLGVDVFLVVPFTPAFSSIEPEEFVHDLLVDRLHVAAVLVGENFHFGHRGAGDLALLEELGPRFGFTAEGIGIVAGARAGGDDTAVPGGGAGVDGGAGAGVDGGAGAGVDGGAEDGVDAGIGQDADASPGPVAEEPPDPAADESPGPVAANSPGSGDIVVSSTYVRSCVDAGEVRAAAVALGRPHRVEGVVVHGDGRGGSALGYPTANLDVVEHAAVPADGIYAGWFLLGSRRSPAAISIGTNPTFSGQDRTVEAFVLDSGGNFYGRRVALDFVQRLRGMERFDTVEALIEQIGADVEQTRRVLEL